MGGPHSPILWQFWMGPPRWPIFPELQRRPPMHPIHHFYEYLLIKSSWFVNYAVPMKITPKNRWFSEDLHSKWIFSCVSEAFPRLTGLGKKPVSSLIEGIQRFRYKTLGKRIQIVSCPYYLLKILAFQLRITLLLTFNFPLFKRYFVYFLESM